MSRRFELLRLLQSYPATPAEAKSLARTLDLIQGPGDPFSKYRFDPGHVTVGSFVTTADRESVLLVHHRRLGIWIEPGGHVDPADPGVLATARRELAEETGIEGARPIHEGIFDLDVHPIPAHKGEPPHAHFNITFAFEVDEPAEPVHQADEVFDARWHPIDDLATLTTDSATRRGSAKLRRT